MKSIHQISFIVIPFLLCACSGASQGYKVEPKQEVKISEFTDDVKVPSSAWDLLEFKSHGPEATAAGAHGGQAMEAAKTLVFSQITVVLVQKNPGIIKDEAVKISLPKGGGIVDLAEYVTGKKGSFYVGFEFPQFENALEKKVVFVSGTRKRKIAGKIFGSGCNQYFEITDKFLKEMKGEGLKVNTTHERYLSVLGGTFLFAAKKEAETHVAQVTFKNSQYPSLFCKER